MNIGTCARAGNTVLLDAAQQCCFSGMTADDSQRDHGGRYRRAAHRLNGKRTVLLQQTQGQGAPHARLALPCCLAKRYF
ncbi:MAG: hypothetical protein R2912_04770 [Eubacteriales bacterium]